MVDEHEELTEPQTAELREDLLRLEEELRRQISGADAGSRPVDLDEPIGRLSRMEAIQQQQMTRASRERNRRRLEMIATALERIEEDDYGFCVVCDEPIGYRRLKARPEWPVCVRCQAAREDAE